MREVALRASGQVWDAVSHGTTAYAHGVTGIVLEPDYVAAPLRHNGGYAVASPADL